MEKKALLGTGMVTAFKAAKDAFNIGGKKTLTSRFGTTVDTGVSSLAKTHGYKGTAGGMLKRSGGEVAGLSTKGKVIGTGVGALAAGYTLG